MLKELKANAKSLIIPLSLCGLALFLSGGVSAEDGVTQSSITIGQSCALKGPAQALGQGMRDGALAYFRHINAEGGIKGKKIKLITLNDGYEPTACVANTRQLLEKDKVFLLFGYVGTPASKAVFDHIKKSKVPYFAPLSGAEFLRNPLTPGIFNIRASFYQETEAMIKILLMNNLTRIAVFYQNDSYGKAGLKGVQIALKERGRQITSKASYERNTLDVENAVSEIAISNPDAVIMIGAYKACAMFVRLTRDGTRSRPVFLNVSLVGSEPLATTLSNKGLGVVITQVVPFPFDKRKPVVDQYHQMTREYMKGATISFTGMEGFIAAKTLCSILEKMSHFTHAEFVRTAESISESLGGFNVQFSPKSRQGSELVHFTQIGPGGSISNIDNLSQLYKYWD
ncbi:MAG: ABC transporter substrate-binding protein [Thermodesulfobacteriota bacterium]|nr:ABC transporter substrate-binding protein [Thermodesulfobacteriota bacterium]